jgi:serine/threonine-protein kinase
MATAERPPTEPAAQEADPFLGKVLNDKFKLLSLLATGGMGTIYRGEQLTLQRPVAIKVLGPSQAASQVDPNFHKRFFLEASILSKLQHPNIVTVFDYGRIEGMVPERYFMAMEYLDGETLFRHLRVRGPLPPPEAMSIARQIARGLREAHKHGVVHRDLKPSNIMLIPGEEGADLVKILDFGLVKVLADDSEELTQQGAFLGSPRYMSPEQISRGKVDLRTDVYSLGVILYQLLCGKVPFESEKSVQILIAHLHTPVPRMRDRNPEIDVPEPLEQLVMSCLAKNPEARPANMDAFTHALSECAHAIGLSGQFGSTGIVTPDSSVGMRGSPVPAHDDSASRDDRAGRVSLDATPPLGAASAEDSGPSFRREDERSREQLPAAPGGAPGAPEAGAPAPGSGNRKGVLWAIGVALLAGAVALGGALRLSQPPPAPVATRAPPPEAPAQPPPAPTPPEVKSFGFLLESEPPGAEVLDGAQSIGRTPLRLTISNEAVRAKERSFVVQLAGYVPYTVYQGPSEKAEVQIVAKLAKAEK